ncbi:CAP domain-containing protein [Paraburkholderia sediminicola]|uniref:CAP domain-containing protein n=1 Tax=Paraburkholderia sediminicola TaxID=458836 RepID=UPI0038BABB21
MKNQKIALPALSLAATMMLAACGGGGGGSSNTGAAAPASGASTPVVGTAIAPQTSVPASTYAAATMQSAAFSQLNAYRLAMGVGELKQDTILDSAAQAHALYLDANLGNGSITALSHNEVSTLSNYYEATPLSRAQKAGAPVTEWIGEEAAAGNPQANATAYASDCIGQYLNSVYHLEGATSNQETVGIGFTQSTANYVNYTCVLDYGQVSGVSGTPQGNGLDQAAGQQMSTTAIATSPLANETGVALTLRAESPNSVPDVAAPGRPVFVRVRADKPGDVLTVTSFTLTAANGSVVPARIIVPRAALTGSTSAATADVNNELPSGVAFLVPLAPLTANTTYTASFSGARDGSPISKSWPYSTGAN